jgi:hypothetical protein
MLGNELPCLGFFSAPFRNSEFGYGNFMTSDRFGRLDLYLGIDQLSILVGKPWVNMCSTANMAYVCGECLRVINRFMIFMVADGSNKW